MKNKYLYILLFVTFLIFFNGCSLIPFKANKSQINIQNNSSKTLKNVKFDIELIKEFKVNKYDLKKDINGNFLVYNNILIFHDMNSVYFYSLKNKNIIFSNRYKSTIFSSFLIDYNGNIVFSNGTMLYVYDLKGKKIFSKDFFENIYSLAIHPSNDLYILTDIGTIYKLKEYKIFWKKKLNTTITSNLIITYNKNIIFGDANGNIYSFDSNGEKLWVSKISGSAKGNFATDLRGNIYVLSSNNILYSIDNSGKIIWNKIYDNVSFLSNILIDRNEKIYISSNKNIYIYDKNGNELSKIPAKNINTKILLLGNNVSFTGKNKSINIYNFGDKKILEYVLNDDLNNELYYTDGNLYCLSKDNKIIEIPLKSEYNSLTWPYEKGYLNREYLNLPPNKPTIIYPEDKNFAVIESDLNLKWNGSDPNNDQITFDVYYGYNENDLLVFKKNLLKKEVNINNLIGKKDYYIKIVASDGMFKSESSIYKFKIIYKPSKPKVIYPQNEAKNIELNPILKWEVKDKDSTNLVFNIYFGEDKKNLALLEKGLYKNEYQLKKTLLPGKKYYWKVEVFDEDGNKNISEIKSFETSHLPTKPILLTKNTELSYDATISWIATDIDNDKLVYDVYIGINEKTLKKIFSDYSNNKAVLPLVRPGKKYKIKIVAKDKKGNISESVLYDLKIKFSPIVKWINKLNNKVETSPVLDENGNIIIGDNGGNLYKFNPDGILIWKIKVNKKIWSSPSYYNGNIYFGDNEGYLYTINSDGEIKWKFKTGDIITSSPIIDKDNIVYVGSWDGYLYAINPDGTLKWKFKTNNSISGSPVMGRDGTIYVGSWDGYLYAINPDGTLKWKFKSENRISKAPAIDKKEIIYFGSEDGYLYAIDYQGNLKWSFKTKSYIKSSPIIDENGNVYIGSWDQYLYAINPDGTLKWKFKSEYIITSTPIIGNHETIYFASYDYNVYCLDYQGNLKWRKELGNILGTNLLLENNALILADINGNLYSLMVEDESINDRAEWPAFKKDNYNTGKVENVRNSLPLGPDNPYPFNNQQDVSLYTKFSWQSYDMDGDPIRFDIYLGTTPEHLTLVAKNLKSSEYKPEEILKPKTQYYWKIIVRDNRNGIKEGPLWTFRTINPYGKIKWNFKTKGWIESVPLIINNNIYFGSYDKHFYSLSISGKLNWKILTDGEIVGSAGVDENGNVYFGNTAGTFFSVSKEGKILWKYKINNKITSTPLVIDNNIYFGDNQGNFYCFTLDGKIKWKFFANDYITGIPFYNNGNILFASADSYLYNITKEGTLIWKFKTNGAIRSSPSVDKDGNIYIGSDDNYLYKISDKGTLIWKFKTKSAVQSKVSIDKNGNIYFGSLDHNFYVLDKDGKIIEIYKVDGGIISTPTFDDNGNIYFGSLDSTVYALDKSLKIDWKFESGYGISSSPIIKDGLLYICSKDGYLYALKIEGKNTPEDYIIKNYFNK
ncbi:cell surface protein [Marinitoga sp. 1197]|uniref:outer membrane protein assembly factor BamB family protein n=1 Tax=Marinitoga sp. 1197 TaxID=1428449 RepID=UPI000659A652|nr:PQQ-binding-like beta-propeller repeat protein [Marinitoga sp. 1197]KLO23033.1 cell surface protein [Marinitoga sp. 1197]